MIRHIALTALLVVLFAPPAVGQGQEGHVYSVAWYDAKTGHEAAYTQAYRDYLIPVFNQLKQRGASVSFFALSKNTGSANSTHMVMVEFPNWAAMDSFNQHLDEASRAVHGRPFAEIVAEQFVPHRDPRGSEIYVAP